MVYKIKNPETGHSIKKGGKIYKDLEEKKSISGKEKTSRRRKFKAILDKDTPKEVKVNPSFKVDREGDWEKKKPHTMKQRRELHEKCGDDAFLLPEHLKFPICNKVKRKNHKCSYNCEGVKGASRRAGEWGYKRVLKNSKELTEELGCYKKSKEKKSEPKKEKKISFLDEKKSTPKKEKKSTPKKSKESTPKKEKKNFIERIMSIF